MIPYSVHHLPLTILPSPNATVRPRGTVALFIVTTAMQGTLLTSLSGKIFPPTPEQAVVDFPTPTRYNHSDLIDRGSQKATIWISLSFWIRLAECEPTFW